MNKAEQVFEKLSRFIGGSRHGRGMRNFAKSEVERVMTHYGVSYDDAVKMMQEGKAKLPPVGTRRRAA
jgi:hypothetical protein